MPQTLKLINDAVFKIFFSKGEGVVFLRQFLTAVLDCEEDELKEITIKNPNISKEQVRDKDIILDILIETKNKEQVHLEIQISEHANFTERIMYYNSRLITSQLEKGENFENLKKSITIVITDFAIFKQPKDKSKFHRIFYWYDGEEKLTDIVAIHTIELPRLPENVDKDKDFWFELFKAKTEKDFDQVARRSRIMTKAVQRLRDVSADDEVRALAQEREDARRIGNAIKKLHWDRGKEEGIKEGKEERNIEIAKKMLIENSEIDFIRSITGLSEKEILEIQSEL